MAERRMFAKSIIDSDAFLDMPLSAQALYFHLSMRADDDGFINNPKKIQRMAGASEDDLKLLIAKRFLIVFDTGVVVIKHWRIHNYIQKDRYHETNYTDEKSRLTIKENGAYTLDTECIQDVYKMDTEVRLGKVSQGKDRLERFTPPTLEEVKEYVSEKGLSVDPVQFFNYFEEGNWTDSKGNKVKNWKQKILTWQKFNIKETPSRSSLNNFTSDNDDEYQQQVNDSMMKLYKEFGDG